jgi:hypothetical protein
MIQPRSTRPRGVTPIVKALSGVDIARVMLAAS